MGQLLDPTRQYLDEIGGSPLLSADEEKILARRAQDGLSVLTLTLSC